MGRIEENSKRKNRKGEIQKMILGSIAAVGIVGTALVAPNVLGAMAKLGIISTKRQREVVNRARTRLLERGLLCQNKNGFLEITKAGEEKLRQLKLADFKLNKPKKWDKKWRILIFDIKECRRKTRNQLRQTLRLIGFEKLQQSVWVYPYDCEDLIALLKADFMIGKDMLYIIADEIEGSGRLKKIFNLE
ncbi:MAG: hypothetical protein Q8P86_03270 [bacterium]|nr:hypothetical protein [bacterium]